MYHINCGKESGRNTDAATAEYPDNVLFWRPGENGRFYVTDTDFFIFIGGSTMRNKKGFTLVELVIVIAVIAILAGVMIGTFASVVKKAKESAKMQEMTAQKQEQIANDIDQKLKNAEWLGWTDFEEKLADVMADTFKKADIGSTNVKEAVNDAVEKAFAKYASSIGTSNTGLTEEQVKYIVETALSKVSYSGVTAEQVKAIVNNAVSGTSTLTKSQVQAIVDAAQAKNLTLAQVTAAITEATKGLANGDKVENRFSEIEKNLTASIKDLKDSTLTASDIEALLAKYISGGKVQGDYSWYVSTLSDLTISGKDNKTVVDQLVALSTMAKGGTSFAGKTITIADSVDLSAEGVDFQPIMDFDGTLKGTKDKEVTVAIKPVWNTAEGRNGKTMTDYYKTARQWQKSAVAYGLVASLKEGGVVEGLTVKLNVTMDNPGNQYTYFGGIVGFLDGGTIRDCKVTGTIKGYNRIGGVVGWAKSGTIERVNVEGLTINTTTLRDDYAGIGGIAAYIAGGKVTIDGCNIQTKKDSTSLFTQDVSDAVYVNGIAAQITAGDSDFADKAKTEVIIKNVKIDSTLVTDKTQLSGWTQTSSLGTNENSTNQYGKVAVMIGDKTFEPSKPTT